MEIQVERNGPPKRKKAAPRAAFACDGARSQWAAG